MHTLVTKPASRARRRHPELARHRYAQWARSGRLAARKAGETSHLPQQRHQFAAAARVRVIARSVGGNQVGRLGAYEVRAVIKHSSGFIA